MFKKYKVKTSVLNAIQYRITVFIKNIREILPKVNFRAHPERRTIPSADR